MFPLPFDNPRTYQGHGGVDFPQDGGTPIRAVADGVVGLLSSTPRGGCIIWVDHDRGSFLKPVGVGYAHMNDFSGCPAKGTRVTAGQVIGYVGKLGANSTGNHLHIEMADEAGEAAVWRYFDRNAVIGGPARGGNQTARPTQDIQRLVGADPDNDYGPDTTAKVKLWQAANGLEPDGVWGPLSDAKGFPVPAAPAAPAFPLPDGWYFGPRSGPEWSVSGYFSHGDSLRAWQQRMADRGWTINPDGRYGDQTEAVARAFQAEKGLEVDGKIGPATWAAAWTAPVT